MFAKSLRLPLGKKYQFSSVVNSSHLRLHVRQNELSDNRYAVLVTKKISKRAVVRNDIRRGLTQVLQEIHSTLPKPYDFFVFVTSFGENNILKQELTDSTSKVKI